MLKYKRPIHLSYYIPTLIIGIFAVAIFFTWPTVAVLSAPANRPDKVKITWKIDEQYKDEIKNFRLWRQDNGGVFVWLTALGPDKNGLLPPDYSYIEDQITQAGNYNYYVEAIKNDGQVASSINSDVPLVGVNVVCDSSCRASKIEDDSSTSSRGNSRPFGRRPSVTPIIPFDDIDKIDQKTIACFAERTKPWDDFLKNCETAADNLADREGVSVEGRAETKVARNKDDNGNFCINGGEDNNCRWEDSSSFTSAADAECNGQYYVCNLYYNAEDYNFVRSNILERNITKSAGKPCTTDDTNKAGYCSLSGQCIACNSSQASNNVCQSGGTGFSAISFLIANAIIGAVDCPVKNGCAGKGDVNKANKDGCAGKSNKCNFSQFDKNCNVTVSKGKCVGDKNNSICTIADKICPNGLTPCGNLCCNSNENCTSVLGVQPVCFSDNNKCKPPNILCKHGNGNGNNTENNGVCCGPDYSCGVEPNKGYAYCSKTNACDPETEIECKGGSWTKRYMVVSVTLNLSGFSTCCDKETESCYQTGDKINGITIAGHNGLPLCVVKDEVTECGADKTKCSGLEHYGKIFTCCKNGQEYCVHPSPGGPVPYCREW